MYTKASNLLLKKKPKKPTKLHSPDKKKIFWFKTPFHKKN